MDLSVLICTYNRAGLLKDTLNSLRFQKEVDFSWEVVVVDNNSYDNTKEVVFNFKDLLPNLTYLYEPRQGISFAKNRGIRNLRGKVIALTDDDVLVDSLWIKNIHSFFLKNPDAFCIGGKILPLWEVEPPKWLTEDFYPYLALLDLGEELMEMTTPGLWGANLSFRKDAFIRYGLFNESVGRKGKKLYSGEETIFLDRILQNKEKVFYVPWVVVKHFVPKSRINRWYFRRWKFYHGKTKAIILEKEIRGSKMLFNVPLYAIKSAVTQIFRWLKQKFLFRSDAFLEELELIFYAGFIFKRFGGNFAKSPCKHCDPGV